METVLTIAIVGILALAGYYLFTRASAPPQQVVAAGPTTDPGWATAGLVVNAVVGIGGAILGAVL